jgi:hypothetical protein
MNEKNNSGDTPLMNLVKDEQGFTGEFLHIARDNNILDIPELDLTILNNKGSNILHILVYFLDNKYKEVLKDPSKRYRSFGSMSIKEFNYHYLNSYKNLISEIIARYPEILLQKNIQGKTPMDYDTSGRFKELYPPVAPTPVTSKPVGTTLGELNAKLKQKQGGKRRTLKKHSRRKRTHKHK